MRCRVGRAVGLVLGASALAGALGIEPVSAGDVATAWTHAGPLTPIGMFLAADPIVKAIMLGLAAASLVTWTVCFVKSIELRLAKRRLRRDLSALRQHRFLLEASEATAKKGLAAGLLKAAMAEIRISVPGRALNGLEARIASRLEELEAEAGRSMRSGTGLLATIGSTSPFVGLFGTVWGIMNSFIGISASHTTNLAVVAPGIAEALLATAIGLVAAIPAVVVYNVFARAIASYRALVRQCAAEIGRMASREIDRMALSDRAARFDIAAE